MPNAKLFVDERLGAAVLEQLHEALPLLRELLCRELNVQTALAQIALISVRGLADQAQIAVEIQVLPSPQRSREHLIATSNQLRAAIDGIVNTQIAVRITTVDPANYLVIR